MYFVLNPPKIKLHKEIPWEDYWNDVNRKKAAAPEEEGAWKENLTTAATVFAAATTAAPVQAAIREQIIKSCWPIVDLVQGISYPATYIMISAGVLMVIVGQKSKGLNMIKWASVGYICMQFVPAIMSILADVGDSMQP